jgi:hypothetical protein
MKCISHLEAISPRIYDDQLDPSRFDLCPDFLLQKATQEFQAQRYTPYFKPNIGKQRNMPVILGGYTVFG